MALVVQKYGGSSLASPLKIRRAAERIGALKQQGNDVVVVVSAMGRMTDHLISLAHRTVRHPPQRELDMLMTVGERISMSLLAMVLDEQGVAAISFTGSQSGIVTTSHHTEARILDIRCHRIETEIQKGKVVIIAGFQGVSEDREITTLGRGGSDTTAVALAAALKADRCEILTDVAGLFSADPRLVKDAHLIPELSYEEALELASLGAKMHGRSIEVGKRHQVPIHIVSSAESEAPLGTWIRKEAQHMERPLIRGIATQDGFHYFSLPLPLKPLTETFKKHSIALRFFSHSATHTEFLCSADKAAEVRKLVAPLCNGEEIGGIATVSAVGDGIASEPTLLYEFVSVLAECDIPCRLICSNTFSITAAVPRDSRELVTQRLHERLVEKK